MSLPNVSARAVRERAVTLFFLLLARVAGVYAFLSLGCAEDPAFTLRQLEELLARQPDVKSLSAYLGGGAPRFFIAANPEPPDPAWGKIVAVTQNAAACDRIMALLRQHIAAGEFGAARVRVYRLLYGPPVIWPIQFRVLGPKPNTLREIAHQLREVMAQNPTPSIRIGNGMNGCRCCTWPSMPSAWPDWSCSTGMGASVL